VGHNPAMPAHDHIGLTRIRLYSEHPLTGPERDTIATRFSRDYPSHGKLVVHAGREAHDADERWARFVTPMVLYTERPPAVEAVERVVAAIERFGSETHAGRVRARAKTPTWARSGRIDEGDVEAKTHSSWMANLPPLVQRDRYGRRVRWNPTELGVTEEYLRLPMEEVYAAELDALEAADKAERPAGWRMSPASVKKYILGTDTVRTADGSPIVPKFIGPAKLVEVAIATLITDRGLLLMGEPGTAKSWLSEHLAAAICRDSQQIVQGTAGTTEEQIRYSWNYALLLAHGPRPDALVPSPIFRCMQRGTLARFEEITRCASEVQDALITIMSEKIIVVPELDAQVRARPGFNIIATANTRDRGINEMSAALKRRFNIVLIPLPTDLQTEVRIVTQQVERIGTNLRMPASPPPEAAVARIVQVFQELRRGQTLDGTTRVRSPTATLSTAEAISSLIGAMALAAYFGNGVVTDADIAASVYSTITRDDPKDLEAYEAYLQAVISKRPEYAEYYEATKRLLA